MSVRRRIVEGREKYESKAERRIVQAAKGKERRKDQFKFFSLVVGPSFSWISCVCEEEDGGGQRNMKVRREG